MKTKTFNLWMFALCLLTFCLQSCSDDDDEGRKITSEKLYELTVASEKVPGVLVSDGSNLISEVYAVKKEGFSEWTCFGDILYFDYEEGYEYKIQIKETNYLDNQMGTPAWTEYQLLKVLSKEKKVSENLPEHFIPKWFYEKGQYIPEYRFIVDADDLGLAHVGRELERDQPLLATCHVIFYQKGDKWLVIDSNDKLIGKGTMKHEFVLINEFPDSYKLLPLGQIQGTMRWTFVDGPGSALNMEPFDVFLALWQRTKALDVDKTPDPWLYRDVTDYFQKKYPNDGIKAVVYTLGLKVDF